jgi:GDSL-like Lipase/Acylhydrolase family
MEPIELNHPAPMEKPWGPKNTANLETLKTGVNTLAEEVKELQDEPSFSGNYNDLTNKPTIPNSPDDIGAQPAGDYLTAEDLPAPPTLVSLGAQPAGDYLTEEDLPAPLTLDDLGGEPAGLSDETRSTLVDPAELSTANAIDLTLLPFSPTSPWRLGVAETAKFAPDNDPRNVDIMDVDTGGSLWVNSDQYSHPIAYASDTDPLATVTDSFHLPTSIPPGGSWQERIPPTARIAAGTDAHMHIITPDRRFVQEHFGTSRQSDTAYATFRRHQVDLTGSGLGPQNGTRAYGGSAIGGLIRRWEIDPAHPNYTGEIRHPLALALRPDQAYYSGVTLPEDGNGGTYNGQGYGLAQGYIWPATEQDASSPQVYTGTIPMGAYFAIPASVSLNTLGLSPQVLMVAKAMQDYGVYVTDTSGSTALYFEDDGSDVMSAFTGAVVGPPNWGNQFRSAFKLLRWVTNNTPETPNGGPLGATRRGTTGYVRVSDLKREYQPLARVQTRPGALQAIAIGDSTTMGDSIHPAGWPYNANGTGQLSDGTYPAVGSYEYRHGPRSWFEHACWASNGRLRPMFNAGQGTDTTTGMLRRFPIDVVAKKPDIVFLGDSHNDSGGEALTRSNILAMIDQAEAAGIRVALVTAYPSDNVGKSTQMRRNNAWLKSVAQSRRLILCDKYAAVADPVDGTFLTAMTNDGTHASYAGAKAAGLKVLADLNGVLSGGPEWLPTDNTSDINLLTNPLFINGSGGYYFNSAMTGTFETDAARFPGRALVGTATAAGAMRHDITMSAKGIEVGDRLKWVGLARVTNGVAGNLRWNLEMWATGIGSYIVRPVETTASGMDMDWFYFEGEMVVPAGATAIRIAANVISGTGVISLAQQGLYNLTKLGIAAS